MTTLDGFVRFVIGACVDSSSRGVEAEDIFEDKVVGVVVALFRSGNVGVETCCSSRKSILYQCER